MLRFGETFPSCSWNIPRVSFGMPQKIQETVSAFLSSLIRKEPVGKNAKGKNFGKLRGRKKCSKKIFQKISQKIEKISLLLDLIVFLDIFEIFAEDCLLFFSEKFSEVLPSGFFTLKPFPADNGPKSPLCPAYRFWHLPSAKENHPQIAYLVSPE